MPMPGDQTTTEKGPTGEQGRGPSAERTQGGGTGGGGSAPAAPQPTAEAPKPETGAGVGSHRTASPDGGTGVGSGLQPGGTKPTNERLAGMRRLGTPGASSGPDAAPGKPGP
jgi:hypothetical protein